ncbi:MAG: amino acid adenylation domain-containing protein [Pirellulaceae bacterium]|nr:amino acid adenylation domain-containing protein [Planctomycetales bacterium]
MRAPESITHHDPSAGVDAANFLDALRRVARTAPNRSALTYYDLGPDLSDPIGIVTYGQLMVASHNLTQSVLGCCEPGDRAVLSFSTGPQFIAAYLACLQAGIVAVPVKPAPRNRDTSRLEALIDDAQPKVVLGDHAGLAAWPHKNVPLIDVTLQRIGAPTMDMESPSAPNWVCQSNPVADDDLAMLQYTSGSTSAPKGVRLTHGNLWHNIQNICCRFGVQAGTVSVTWLPHYHDMGLIGALLAPLAVGSSIHVMSPTQFLQRPWQWLRLISQTGAEISGAPNFAYDLCVRYATHDDCLNLDLRAWRLAFNGAEPIRRETLRAFERAFGKLGFRSAAWYPCYGLAEATLLVTGPRFSREPQSPEIVAEDRAPETPPMGDDSFGHPQSLVACGTPIDGTDVVIVDPQSHQTCRPGSIGEIWVHGPSVSKGYWRVDDPDNSSAAAIHKTLANDHRKFLPTGDLGFIHGGELVVCGRIKDLIIVSGSNYYPQDIETVVVACHSRLDCGRCAAFPLSTPQGEMLGVACEVARHQRRGLPTIDVFQAIRTAIIDRFDISPTYIALLTPGQLPLTTSGKLRRQQCATHAGRGDWKTIAIWTSEDPSESHSTPVISSQSTTGDGVTISPRSVEEVVNWLVARIAETCEISPLRVDTTAPFTSLGIDSVRAARLTGDVEQFWGRRLSPTAIYEFPSIGQLARHLADGNSHRFHAPDGELDERCDRPAKCEPIAIVGMACRFPMADNLAQFWQLLRHGICAVRRASPHRLACFAAGHDPDEPAGYLDRIDQFATEYFGISPREAIAMDPRQRLLMEVAVEAILDAGYAVEQLRSSRTGIFVGLTGGEYDQVLGASDQNDFLCATGAASSIAANRLSYYFDWVGPSIAVDTACSSSLVALHLAIESLQRGECTMAMVGGANLLISPRTSKVLRNGRFLSPDARCYAFDRRANGYVRGEGVGAVMLKPLSSATRDNDPVYAVIRGSAINQDGRSNGLTAPNPAAQRQVILSALKSARVGADQIGYVEAHGTGTALGDPIEARTLGEVLSQGRHADRPCYLGSVKTNIGHLEPAAGIASVIKVALMVEHQSIVPSLHFEYANPLIPLDELYLDVPTRVIPWPSSGLLSTAAVSSFGFGGTNAHVILQSVRDALRPTGHRKRLLPPHWKRGTYWPLRSLTDGRDEPAAIPARNKDVTLEQYLVRLVADILHANIQVIDLATPLAAMGVDSVMALELADQIADDYHIELPTTFLASNPTLLDVATYVDTQLRECQTAPGDAHPPRNAILAPSHGPPSQIQQQLWTLGQISDASGVLNIAMTLQFHGDVDSSVLQCCLQLLVDRHDALRTTVAIHGRSLQQTVHYQAAVALRHLDLRAMEAEASQTVLKQEWKRLSREPFDSSDCPPWLRATYIQLDNANSILGLAVSHLVCDGWSLRILADEFAMAYEALCRDEMPTWPEGPAPSWMPCLSASCDCNSGDTDDPSRPAETALDTQVSLASITLPYDMRPNGPRSFKGSRVDFAIDVDFSHRIVELCRLAAVTPFVAFSAATLLVLSRYANDVSRSLPLGFTSAGRTDGHARRTVGPWLRPLVMNISVDETTSVREWLVRVAQEVLRVQQEGACDGGRESSGVRNRFSQVAVDYQDALPEIRMDNLRIVPTELDNGASMSELSLAVRRKIDSFHGHVQFANTLFGVPTALRFAEHCKTVLHAMCDDPSQSLAELPLLSRDESKFLDSCNTETVSEYCSMQTVAMQVHSIVQQQPGQTAIIDSQQQLTYDELWLRTESLAAWLDRIGVTKGDRVGLLLRRSVHVPAVILAVLRLGAVYVPVDEKYPRLRKLHVIGDAKLKCLVSDLDVDELKDDERVPPIVDLRQANWEQSLEPRGYRDAEITPRDPAYILYTSGSTGAPKGVVVTHGNLLNFLHAMDVLPGVKDSGTWLAITSIAFDISVFELLWTLSRGFRVIVIDDPLAATQRLDSCKSTSLRLPEIMRRYDVSHLQCTPALAHVLMADPELLVPLSHLKFLFVGGEAIPLALARKLSSVVRGQVYNMYGPTETTVWSTAQLLTPHDDCVLIGRPLANTQTYVLDQRQRRLPCNVPGELYIGGDGVSHGYFGRDDETGRRFIANPFRSGEGRLFRTGDKVMQLPDGSLRYLGRLDSQTKIFGHRIEAGDLELALAEHPLVVQAVVVIEARGEEPQTEVHAFVTTRDNTAVSVETLRQHLTERLPAAVIPTRITVVSRFPLTANGKIDRKALSEWPTADVFVSDTMGNTSNHQVLGGLSVDVLCQAAADELGYAVADWDASATELGLSSVDVIRIVHRIETALGIRPAIHQIVAGESLATVFQHAIDVLSSHSGSLTASVAGVRGEREPTDAAALRSQSPPTPLRRPPPSNSVLSSVARRRQRREVADLHHNYARYVEPVKSELLGRVGLDIAYCRGQGMYLWDAEDTQYLDFVSQYGALPFGYNPREIWKAVAAVRRKRLPSVATNSLLESAGQLAAKLLECAPLGMEHVVFCNSGAEAMEVAIKLVRSATGRRRILAACQAFHGLTTGALSVTGEPEFRDGFGVDDVNVDHVPFGDSEAVRNALAAATDRYAAVIVEPIQGEAGILLPPAGYLTELRSLCDQHQVLLVFDEVQTGLGRTGRLFACQHEQVNPDVMTLAKALGGGLVPIGAVLCNRRAYSDRFGLRHSSTFAGNSLACQVGLASLQRLRDNGEALVRHVATTGRYLLERLQQVSITCAPLVRQVRGRGLMLAMEFDFDSLHDHDGLLPILVEQQMLIHLLVSYLLHGEGIRVAPSFMGRNVLRIQPALIAERQHCDRFCQAMERALKLIATGRTDVLVAPLAGIRGREFRQRVAQTVPLSSAAGHRRTGTPADRCAKARVRVDATQQTNGNSRVRNHAKVRNFGFIVHLAALSDLARFDPLLADFDVSQLQRLKKTLAEYADPFVIGRAEVASRLAVAGRVRGTFVMIPCTPAELVRMPRDESIGLVQQAVDLVAGESVEVIGLGGFSSVVTAGGLALDRRSLPPITSGNAFTVNAAVSLVREKCRERGVSPHESTAAVIGAAGQIGQAVAIDLSGSFKRLVFIGRRSDSADASRRLRDAAQAVVRHALGQRDVCADSIVETDDNVAPGAVAELVRARASSLRGEQRIMEKIADELLSDGTLQLASDCREGVAVADVIVGATSATEPFLEAAWIKRHAIVCDVSRPSIVPPAVIKMRDDVDWLEGGVIQLPGQPKLGVYAGPAVDRTFACVAETMLLAWQPELRSTDVTAELDAGVIRQLGLAAQRHGLTVLPHRLGAEHDSRA